MFSDIIVRLPGLRHLEEDYPITKVFEKKKTFSSLFANGLITFMNLRVVS